MIHRLSLVLLLVATGCGAINSVPVTDASTATDTATLDARADGATDAGVDAPRDMNVPEVVADSGCPAPRTLTPADLPATGFLAPIRARFIRAVDGDTAHFAIPITGEVDVRFLWVNTEESHGTETTAFGVATANWATATMPTVGEYTLVFQASTTAPTQPALDMYGRRLGLVFADNALWQTRLVRDGWTAYYTDFGCAPEPIHTTLLNAEAEARANRRGIWAPGHPTDYAAVFTRWISNRCRPNPFRNQAYCTR